MNGIEVDVVVNRAVDVAAGAPASAEADFGQSRVVTMAPESYEGEYEIVPQNFAQVLETMDKLMNDDVRVHPIQYREMPLSAGGLEISIGGVL